MALLTFCAWGAFEIDELFCGLPDRVAVELEFLDLLLYRQAQARANDDIGALASAAALKCRFLDARRDRWVADFGAAISSGARTAFYRQLAVLTERVVRSEAARER